MFADTYYPVIGGLAVVIIILFFSFRLKLLLKGEEWDWTWNIDIYAIGLFKFSLNRMLNKAVLRSVDAFLSEDYKPPPGRGRIDMLPAGKLLIGILLSSARLKVFSWRSSYAFFDAALTGKVIAVFWILQLGVRDIITRYLPPAWKVRDDILLEPSFGNPGFSSIFRLEVKFSLAYFIMSMLSMLCKKNKNTSLREAESMHDDHSIDELIRASVESIRDVVDVNTIIGEPIETADGMTIIPVSKITVGFGAGGMDLSKSTASGSCGENIVKTPFGGGTGAGITVQPVAFLVAGGGQVRLMNLENTSQFADKFIEFAPQVLEQFQRIFKKKKEHKKSENEQDINID